MALEIKEVAEYLGLKVDELKDLESFKTKFDTEFIKQSNITEDNESVKKILGKTFGTLENEIKKVAKGFELDIDFNSDDLKDKKVTDKLKFVVSEYDAKQKTVIEELKKSANQGNDEKVKEWEEKYTKAINKAKDYETLLKTTKTELETVQQNSSKEIKNIKLDIFKTQALSKVKFKADINEFEKEGYLSKIEKNYKFDLDETGKPVIFDKEGKRIPNPKVNGTFMDIEEVLQDEAVKGKLFQLNPDAGKKVATPIKQQQQQQNNPIIQTRVVAQRLG